MSKYFIILTALVALSGCAKTYVNQNPVGTKFPSVEAESLEQTTHSLPNYFSGKQVVLLLGYKQNSQFDIDRWLIGLDMAQVPADVYELPTIQGWVPSLIKGTINEGMRKGIPEEIWRIVLTIYEDGEAVQEFTGNANPNNARAIVLSPDGTVVYFYDRGFSVAALNELKAVVTGDLKAKL